MITQQCMVPNAETWPFKHAAGPTHKSTWANVSVSMNVCMVTCSDTASENCALHACVLLDVDHAVCVGMYMHM